MVKLFEFKDTPTDAVSVLRATLFAIIPPTILFAFFQKQITDGAMKVLGWIDSNQDKIAGYYNLFQQIRAGNPITPPVQDVPGVPPPPAE